MSEEPDNSNTQVQLKKYCTDGKMEEGGIGKIKVRKTANTEGDTNGEKRKWPMLCDANPYIVDLLRNIFKKEEPPPEPEPAKK
ncbi:hypothetical protein KPH14_004088 [Odynerus spinipes]|uniref:Uncharacterized protein n=1 Tax=Odynerus spinipes TaxID=1348599 RepID=A0AAD9RY88_9HYME|nr:hypothetical protein KPH14_004088 [Odynerus spinipes]